jgi:GNAT superfamily N-acetyltransferase
MYDEVRAFHQEFLVPTFAANEVEDVELWEERLKDQHDEGPLPKLSAADIGNRCEFAVALLVRKQDGRVMGGASHEVYLASRSALISYMVVSSELRGRGAAKLLVDAVFSNGESVVQTAVAGPLAAVVIEVLQVRDDHDDDGHHGSGAAPAEATFRSADRQVIFKKLGFQPVDLDFVHPGKLKGHRYNIGVASRSLDVSSGQFPADVLLAFLEGLVMGILADEGSTDETEMKQWRELLADRDWVGVGDSFWR